MGIFSSGAAGGAILKAARKKLAGKKGAAPGNTAIGQLAGKIVGPRGGRTPAAAPVTRRATPRAKAAPAPTQVAAVRGGGRGQRAGSRARRTPGRPRRLL